MQIRAETTGNGRNWRKLWTIIWTNFILFVHRIILFLSTTCSVVVISYRILQQNPLLLVHQIYRDSFIVWLPWYIFPFSILYGFLYLLVMFNFYCSPFMCILTFYMIYLYLTQHKNKLFFYLTFLYCYGVRMNI